tara:strand:- start:3239 stop:3349 length:111 start_codon:yes stop_codon:yes gene_type:complete
MAEICNAVSFNLTGFYNDGIDPFRLFVNKIRVKPLF